MNNPSSLSAVPSNDLVELPQVMGLTHEQRIALMCLAGGQTHARAARLANVCRATLYKLQKNDPAFVAALNAWRDFVTTSARDRLLQAIDHAVNAVINAAARGDMRAALALLKGLGVLSPPAPAPGPVEPDSAREELHLETYENYVRRLRLRIEAGMTLVDLKKTQGGHGTFQSDRVSDAKQLSAHRAEIRRLEAELKKAQEELEAARPQDAGPSPKAEAPRD